MNAAETVLIAFSLAMDCFSVSIIEGLTTKNNRILNGFKVGAFFGLFQAFMPLIGWFGGLALLDMISGFDHWAAFSILSLIGSKMILETMHKKTEDKKPRTVYMLIMLSVATSIDALVVGVSLAFFGTSIIMAIATFGIVTFLLSFLGIQVGYKFGSFFGQKVGAVGGLILIGIGTKILIEHLV